MNGRLWTPMLDSELIRRWKAGAPASTIAAELGRTTGATKMRLAHLRRHGKDLPPHPRGWTAQARSQARKADKKATGMRHDPEDWRRDVVIGRPMAASVLNPAIVYDRYGKPVATMDPYSRKRAAV